MSTAGHPPEPKGTPRLFEFTVAAFALIALLWAQWMLSAAIRGSNYPARDGKMAQTTVLAALRFGGWFNVTNISPIEGVGSQLLPMNAWTNPAYWPFAFFDKEQETDVSALVALAVFVMACYILARCFNVPVIPSAIAAQLCIVLFAPAVLILRFTTVFCLTPGDAVVYCPLSDHVGPAGPARAGVVAPLRRDHRQHFRALVVQHLLRPVVDHGLRDQLRDAIRRRQLR
jgi:hypothetical protein